MRTVRQDGSWVGWGGLEYVNIGTHASIESEREYCWRLCDFTPTDRY
jgi:hypothetical protein